MLSVLSTVTLYTRPFCSNVRDNVQRGVYFPCVVGMHYVVGIVRCVVVFLLYACGSDSEYFSKLS